MKTIIHEKSKGEEGKFKKALEVLMLVFSLTMITVILALSELKENESKNSSYSEEYVSVFKESEFYEILGFSNTGAGEIPNEQEEKQ